MIRRAPAEGYYKYLIVHPQVYDNAYIQSIAQELSLDYLGDWYIQWLRERLRPPSPFYPEDLTHTKSQHFLMKEALVRPFHPDKNWSAVLRLLNKPRVREVVETMLLSQAPYTAIVHALDVRHSLKIAVEGVRLFKCYFWDIDLLDSMEMRALLDMRHSGVLAGAIDKDALAQLPSIKRMRHTDPRVVASRLPHTPLAAALAQLELGVMPRKMDLGLILDQAQTVTLLRGAEAAHNGGPLGATMSQSFFSSAETLQRLKGLVVNPEDKLRSDLKRISLATTQNKVPTLAQLTNGNHTTNVHPEPKVGAQVADAIFDEVDEEGDTDDSER
jgi:hypothetical protein